jgi:hypothetical protein
MKGAGYYDQHSTAQRASIQALQDWIDDAVTKLPLPAPPQPVTILDLGSSEGRNAIHGMAAIVDALRRRTHQPLQTVYSDLASNDFNQFFANLETARRDGLVPAGVYPAALGGSFYGPLLPPGTVHLATSFNSIQWLDHLPSVSLPNDVVYRRPHPSRPERSVSPEVTAAFQQQAEQDMIRFLESRARELVPGGKLLLSSPGDGDQARVSDGFSDVLNDACLDMVAAGQLKRADYERLTFPSYFRTVSELLAPLEREGSPVHGAFSVDRAEAFEVPTPFMVEFRRSGNVEAYARAYTGFMRAISEPVIKAALRQPAGTVEHESNGEAMTNGGAVTLERLYWRIQARLQAEPERYLFHYILVVALLTRR